MSELADKDVCDLSLSLPLSLPFSLSLSLSDRPTKAMESIMRERLKRSSHSSTGSRRTNSKNKSLRYDFKLVDEVDLVVFAVCLCFCA